MSDQAAAWLAASVLPPLGALRTAPATARAHVRGTLAVWRLSGDRDWRSAARG